VVDTSLCSEEDQGHHCCCFVISPFSVFEHFSRKHCSIVGGIRKEKKTARTIFPTGVSVFPPIRKHQPPDPWRTHRALPHPPSLNLQIPAASRSFFLPSSQISNTSYLLLLTKRSLPKLQPNLPHLDSSTYHHHYYYHQENDPPQEHLLRRRHRWPRSRHRP